VINVWKVQIKVKGTFLELSTLFLWTNIVCLSARNSAEKRRKGLQKNWLCAANSSSAWHTGLSGGAPDSVRCARLVLGELAALGIRRRRTAKNYRTVRWFTGLSGEPTVAWATVGCAIFARHVECSNGQLVHRTVSGAPISPKEQRSDMPNLEGDLAPDSLQDLSGGAPDCPVHHSTEGKDSLPCWSPTAPRCLWAIKGTPRRMEKEPKHSLSILRLPHSASTYLIDCVSDLSSVRVVNSLCYVLSSSLGLCACVWCRFVCCVCCSPSLTLVPSLWSSL
jgi:hypothetical protein